MKWEEIKRGDNNPLIAVLSMAGAEEGPFLYSRENFTKLYNVYAKNNLDPDYLNSGNKETWDYVYYNLIFNEQMYKFSEEATIEERIRKYNSSDENQKKITRKGRAKQNNNNNQNNQITKDNVNNFISSRSKEEISILKDAIANFENQQ